MNIVQQFKYNNSNDYELIKRIRRQVIKLIYIRIPSSFDIRQKFMVLAKIKPVYSDILYNPAYFHGPLVYWIRQVPLYNHWMVCSNVFFFPQHRTFCLTMEI